MQLAPVPLQNKYQQPSQHPEIIHQHSYIKADHSSFNFGLKQRMLSGSVDKVLDPQYIVQAVWDHWTESVLSKMNVKVEVPFKQAFCECSVR